MCFILSYHAILKKETKNEIKNERLRILFHISLYILQINCSYYMKMYNLKQK